MNTGGSFGLICGYMPISFIMMKLGIKWGVFIGHLVCLAGLLLERMLDEDVWYLIVGFFLCRFGALSSTLSYGSAVALWFEPQHVRLCHIVENHCPHDNRDFAVPRIRTWTRHTQVLRKQ